MIARRIAVVLVGISTCLDGPAAPAGEVESGLKPGATAGAFYVEDVTGPRAGTSLCYACAFAKRAVVNVQTTALTEELGRLLKLLDRHVDDPGRLARDSRHAFLVYLTEDPDSAIDELAAFAERHDLVNVPLTFYDELTGPPSYELSADAEVTVMMWVDTKVTVSLGKRKGKIVVEFGSVDDLQRIVELMKTEQG